jgi:replicative DNA helicase/twinkle protein
VTEKDEEISLLDTIEEAICRYGVKCILLDNLMTAIDVDVKDDLYLSQSKFVKKLKRIATKWEVFILVVAHPRKENGRELNNDSVSGSSDITNAVDIVFTYSRNTGEDKDEFQSVIGVTKNRLSGRLLLDQNRVKVTYSCKSKRIAETIAEKSKIYKCFDMPNTKASVADEYVDILTEDDLGKVVDNYTFTL